MRCAIDIRNIDVPAASRHGVLVTQASAGFIPSVSEWIIGVMIDLSRRSVTKGEREVRLSPTEYGLLSELARHAGTVVDHQTLLREVWGPSHVHERNYLWTFVQRHFRTRFRVLDERIQVFA